MSTFSLPHLLSGGGGLSRNKVVNQKFASLNRFGSVAGHNNGSIPSAPMMVTTSRASLSTAPTSASTMAGLNGSIGMVAGPASKYEMLLARRKTLNRNGSISHNQFRGIKKQMLESQTEMILHTMTVSLVWVACADDYRFSINSDFAFVLLTVGDVFW